MLRIKYVLPNVTKHGTINPEKKKKNHITSYFHITSYIPALLSLVFITHFRLAHSFERNTFWKITRVSCQVKGNICKEIRDNNSSHSLSGIF